MDRRRVAEGHVTLVRYPDAQPPADWRTSVLALGNFDGLHRGHMAIVRQVVDSATASARPSVLLTFDPHPTRIVRPDGAPQLLMTVPQKAELLAHSGIDGVALVRFTSEMSQWPPERFVDAVLVEWLGVSEVWVGANFLFGRDRSGDFARLRALGEQRGFVARNVESVQFAGHVVSSTRIRSLVAAGDVAAAGHLLGREYFLDGVVVKGDGRGRHIGYPTANLEPVEQLLPARGVYATRARIGNDAWPAVTNIGVHPTVGAAANCLIEVHLLEGGRDLYGESVRLRFVERLRDEQSFRSLGDLQRAIAADCDRARAVLA